jgi:hypothetical protein
MIVCHLQRLFSIDRRGFMHSELERIYGLALMNCFKMLLFYIFMERLVKPMKLFRVAS